MNQNESGTTPTALLRRLHHWRMAFFGMVILVAGMLGGAAATLLAVRRVTPPGRLAPPPDVEVLLTRLNEPLHLTAEQHEQVKPILQKHMTRLGQIQEDGRKAIAEELRLLTQEMAGVLTEEQMGVWQRLFLDLPPRMRHIPQELGPGYGRGPGPGPRGWRSPPAGRGPLHMRSTPPAPEANTVPQR